MADEIDELADVADEAEAALSARLGEMGLRRIDQSLRNQVNQSWQKVVRIIDRAMEEGSFLHSLDDEAAFNLHNRRIIHLVESGEFEGQGDLRRPRWSEVRFSAR